MNEELGKKFGRWELAKFVVPTIMMLVFMSLYTIVDGMFVSRLVGSNALSAINITLPVINLLYGLALMVATGGCAIVATNLGEGLIEEAKSRFSFLVYVVAAIGVTFGVVGILFLEPINKMMGASDAILGYANEYLLIMLLFAPVSAIKVMFDFFVVVAGKPNLGFIMTLIGGITNIVLDYIFIGPLGMGIAGAAWATGIGQLIPMIIGLIFFMNRKRAIYLTKAKFEKKILLASMGNGSSEMVTNLATAVTTLLFNMTMMKLLGEDGVAAITVVLYSQFLLTSVYLGFTSGVGPIISYKYGNEDKDQLKTIIRYCFEFVLCASITTFILTYLIAPQVVGAFVTPDNPVYAIAINGFYLFGVSFLFTGINIFASGMFTAFSNGKISAIISFLRTFVFVLVSILVLPMFLQVNGVWLSVPIAEVLALVVSISLIKKYRKVYHY